MNLSRLYGNPAFLQLLPSEREVYLLIQAYKLAQKPGRMETMERLDKEGGVK